MFLSIFNKKSNFKLYTRIGTVSIAIIGIWALFSIPVIVYHTQQYQMEGSNESFPAVSKNNSTLKPLNCSQNFLFNEKTGLCSPICGQWKEISQDQVVAFTLTTTLLYIFHIIGTIAALLFACWNREIMFNFPATLLLYYILSPIVLDISYFIRLIGRKYLLCSSLDLFEAIENSTGFCYFSGVINTFIYTSFAYWWLFLTIMIFWKVWFPTNAKRVEASGYIKYIHIAVAAISIVLSLLPVVAALGTGGYVISSFPVFLNYCYPRNSVVFFYAFILPFCIYQPAGSTFNLLTLYKVISLKQHLINKYGNIKAECRLLVLLFYFAFAAALNLMLFTIGSRNVFQNQQGLQNYFACEASGSDPDDPCVLEVDRHTDHALTVAAFVVYTIGPYATLVYVIPVDKVKDRWRKESSQVVQITSS